MKKTITNKCVFVKIILILVLLSSIGYSMPTLPLMTDIVLTNTPLLGETAQVNVIITSGDIAIINTTSNIELSEGLQYVSGDLTWSGSIKENETIYYNATVKAIKTGNWTIRVTGLGGGKWLYLSVSENETNISEIPFGILPSLSKNVVVVSESEVQEKIDSGSMNVIKEEVVQLNESDLRALPENAFSYAYSDEKNIKIINGNEVKSPGSITIKGYFYYNDRNMVLRPAFGVTVYAYDDDLGVQFI